MLLTALLSSDIDAAMACKRRQYDNSKRLNYGEVSYVCDDTINVTWMQAVLFDLKSRATIHRCLGGGTFILCTPLAARYFTERDWSGISSLHFNQDILISAILLL